MNDSQQRFAQEYVVDQNATEAAKRAGYSEKTAYAQGCRLLKKAEVRSEIDRLLNKAAQKSDISTQRVLRELARLGFADLEQAFDEHGDLIPVAKMPKALRRAVASVEIEERVRGRGDDAETYYVKKIKLWDKPRALELLGKHLKLYTDKVEHEGSVSIAVVDPYAEPKGGEA